MERYYIDNDGDYLMVFGPGSTPRMREARATGIAGNIGSVCTCQVGVEYLDEQCREVSREAVPQSWIDRF